ncbi:MAG: anaerobic ribonucleoside-triphosphate reductase activating protein [Candidatus Bathyarchaeota archaeon]|nr:MAG: anaerobic ribonucleoside-triphosphate reductase activating protein [Candidatus Bathyarchaeota archaeon]
MEIKGVVDLSFTDWDGKISSVLFLPRCNFRCPYCHNVALVLHPETEETTPFERVGDYLKQQKTWIDGICITGGEPTIHNDLPDLCSRLRRMGFMVKLDTNGTNPTMVKALIEDGLVHYIALDIKTALTVEKYSKVTGVNAARLLGNVKKTVELLLGSKMDYEFRTTVVPTLHGDKDIGEICNSIKGCKKYVLQRFDARDGKETLNPDFSKLKSFTDKEMEMFLTTARKFLPNVKSR